MDKMVYFI